MKNRKTYMVMSMITLLFISALVFNKPVKFSHEVRWSDAELKTIRSLIVNNRNENTQEALADLGHQLFFDTDLSGNGEVACASCHQPDKYFSDGEALSSSGMGSLSRHTPSIIGASSQSWFFWDGRKDSLWSQALGPLESSVEHGTNRLAVVRVVTEKYADQYQQLFGEIPVMDKLPLNATPQGENKAWQKNWHDISEIDKKQINKAFANIGIAIAEYEKLIQAGESRFDIFAKAIVDGQHSDVLNAYEQEGLKLFIDTEKTGCINCHNGSLFSNHDFLATGVGEINPKQLTGRAAGIKSALADEFNCFSAYTSDNCDELRFAKTEGDELNAAFKVPTLRNIADTAPYMHDGKFKDLHEVLQYYNEFTPEKGQHVDIQPMRLLPHELKYLEAFLLTLSAPIDADQRWLDAPNAASTNLAGTIFRAGDFK